MPSKPNELRSHPSAFDSCTKGWPESRRVKFMKWALDHGFDLKHPHVWQAVGVWEATMASQRVEVLAKDMSSVVSDLKWIKRKGAFVVAAVILAMIALAGAVGYAVGVNDGLTLSSQSKK